MGSQASNPRNTVLRAGAVLGLLVVGVMGSPTVDARMPAAEARIDAPANGQQIDGIVEIRGRATVSEGGRFAFYRLLIGAGKTPTSMRPLGPPYERPVENGALAAWDTDRFPSGDYLLTLHVYAADDTYTSASTVVTVKYKPTPTPLAILLPTVVDLPTPVAEASSESAPTPVEAPPALDVMLSPVDDRAPSLPMLAPVPTIDPPRAVFPIQPIPLDANNPGPFPVDTPTTYSPGQLPFDPAPVYITPIDFNSHTN